METDNRYVYILQRKGNNMAGIERVSGYKCISCDQVHEELDEAFACCGVEVRLDWTATVSGTTTVTCTSQSEYQDAIDCDGYSLLEIDISDNHGGDTDVNDINVDIDDTDAPEVEE